MKKIPSWLISLFIDFAVATLGGYTLAMLIGAPFVPSFFTIWAAFTFARFWPKVNAFDDDQEDEDDAPDETVFFVKGAFRETIEKQNLEEFKKLREAAKAVSGRLQELKEAGYLEQHHVDTMRNEIDESVEKEIRKSQVQKGIDAVKDLTYKTVLDYQNESLRETLDNLSVKPIVGEKQSEAIDKMFEKLDSLAPPPTLFLNENDIKKAKKLSGIRGEATKRQFEAVLGHKDDKGNYLAPADDNFQADLIGRIPGIYEEIKNRPGTCLTDAEFEEHKNELKNQDAFRLMVEGVFYQLRVVCPAPSNCLFSMALRNEAEEKVKSVAFDSILNLFQKTGETMFGDDFNITYTWDEKAGESLIIKF